MLLSLFQSSDRYNSIYTSVGNLLILLGKSSS